MNFMDMESFRSFLGWAGLLNIICMSFALGLMMVPWIRCKVLKIQTKLFGIQNIETLISHYILFFGLYKILVVTFFIIPYFAMYFI